MTLVKKRDPKQTLQTKRRFGEHHKKGKNYQKIYWPFLPLLIIAGLLVISGVKLMVINHSNLSNNNLITAINNVRSNHRYKSINLDSNLSSLAEVELNQLNNTSSSKALKQVAANLKSTQASYAEYGLNLAYGFRNNNYIINGWLINSSDKQNILNPDYSQIGIASKTINFNHKYQKVIIAIFAPKQAHNIILTPFVSYGSSSLDLSSAEALGITNSKTYLFLTSFIIFILIIILVVRNFKKIIKYFKNSEKYLLKHYLIDIVLILIIIFLSMVLLTVGKVV